MKIFIPFSSFFQKNTIYIVLGLLFTLFLFPQISFADLENFPEATIHSKPEGGNWTNSSTWVEGRVPDDDDTVSIDGRVYLDQRDISTKNIFVNDGSFLGIKGAAVRDLYLSNSIINNGEIDHVRLHINGSFENNGNISTTSLYLNGEDVKELIGNFSEATLVLESNILLKNSFLKIDKLMGMDYVITFLGAGEKSIQLLRLDGEVQFNGSFLFGENVIDETSFSSAYIKAESIHLYGKHTINRHETLIDAKLYIESGAEFRPGSFMYPIITLKKDFSNKGSIGNISKIKTEASLYNNGTIQNGFQIYLLGALERSIIGDFPKVQFVLYDDLYIQNDSFRVNNIITENHAIIFQNPENAVFSVNIFGGELHTNAKVNFGWGEAIEGSISSLNLEASAIYINKDIHVTNREINVKAPFFLLPNSELSYQGSYSRSKIYFHNELINNGTMSNITPYLYESIENNAVWNSSSTYLIWNETQENSFEVAIAENKSDLENHIFSVNRNFITSDGVDVVNNIVKNKEIRFWKVRPINGEWSEIHTINKKLYLEEDNQFFTSSEIPNITENEEVEVTITSSDDYTGDLKIFVDEGNVSQSIVHMENGSVTINLSFDTPQESAQLRIQSQEHNTISGVSNEFDVLHEIEYTFFSMPAIPEAEQEREMQITLHAQEVDYTGDVVIQYYYKKEDGSFTSVIIPNVSISENGQKIFSFTPENITSESYFTFVDSEKDYLKGESNHFFVKKKRRHGGGSTQTVGDTFFSQGEEGGEEQSSSPPEEENGPAEQNDNENTETPADPPNQDAEDNGDEETTSDYLLENTCWNIHSTFSVLSKSLRSQLKDDDNEKQNVKNLQKKLKDLNFLPSPSEGLGSGSVDGDFGNQTEQALKDFQKQNELFVDGKFGTETSSYVKDNCETLQIKQEEEQGDDEDQNPPNDENNDDEDGEQNSPPNENSWSEEIKDWFNNFWDNIRNALGVGEDKKEEVFEEVVEIKEEVENEEEIKIISYNSDVFIGVKLLFEENFLDSIKKLEQFAMDSNIKIHITQSLRNPSDKLTNIVVKPSRKSNHYVGHAIDMNIQIINGPFCNGNCMLNGNYGEVNNFINLIRQDDVLRWGGDFPDVDSVHSDDGLNIINPDEWLRIFTNIRYNKLYE